MNKQPITQANDRDLRLSQVAMQRAALRAQELAKAPAPPSSSVVMA